MLLFMIAIEGAQNRIESKPLTPPKNQGQGTVLAMQNDKKPQDSPPASPAPLSSEEIKSLQFQVGAASYKDYSKYLEQLKIIILTTDNHFITAVDAKKNKILARAFSETLKTIKDLPQFKDYFALLAKHNILDPLNVSSATFDKMSIFEQTRYWQSTETVRAYSVSNLSFDELALYQTADQEISEAFEQYLTELIAANKKEFLPFRLRDLEEQKKINPPPADADIRLEGLTREAQDILKQYQQALIDLKTALKTESIEDDQQVLARLNQIREQLALEVKKEYLNAFVDTPSEPGKQAFKALLMAAAKLKIIDQKIIYCARMAELNSDDALSVARIKLFNDNGIAFSKTDIDPLVYQNQSVEKWIATYPPEVQSMLKEYVNASREYLKSCCDVTKSQINSGRSRANVLFFAMEAAGFSEKELLLLDAFIAYGSLSPELKVLLKGSAEDQIKTCLNEIKRLSEFRDRDAFKALRSAEKSRIIQDTQCLSSILFGLVGSNIQAGYLLRLIAYGEKIGSLLASQLEKAENTPEAVDDYSMRALLMNSFRNGAEQYGLSPLQMIYVHLVTRKIIGEAPDQKYIDEALKHSDLYRGLIESDGRYGLDKFKRELILSITYNALESDLEQKPHLNASKGRLLDWMKNFVNEIRKKLKNDPKYLKSSDLTNRVNILGTVYKILTEFKLFTQEELAKFSLENPLIAAKNNLTVRDFKKGGMHHTVGFENLPLEIKKQIDLAGLTEFYRQNSEYLNVYWIPEEENNKFAGYATEDKSTIVILYRANGKTFNNVELAAILTHELQHKKDFSDLAKYLSANPDAQMPIADVPLLITERNSYLAALSFSEKLPVKTGKEKYMIDYYRDIAIKANLLAGLSENDRTMLLPPYQGIDLNSSALDINPAKLSISLETAKIVLKVLDKMGYAAGEKRWLFEICMLSASGTDLNLTGTKPGARHLLTDFIGRLIGTEETSTNGVLTLPFLQRLWDIQKNGVKEPESALISPQLLISLINYRAQEP